MTHAHAHTITNAVTASKTFTQRGLCVRGIRSIASMIKPKWGYFLTFIHNVFSGGTKHLSVSGS